MRFQLIQESLQLLLPEHFRYPFPEVPRNRKEGGKKMIEETGPFAMHLHRLRRNHWNVKVSGKRKEAIRTGSCKQKRRRY